MKLSIIIPALDECDQLPATLAALTGLVPPPEILVVDGGSTDGTHEWLNRQSCVRVIVAERGRGAQLNAGARAATGNTLLFLHADCLLPPDARDVIKRVLADHTVAGGCFRVRFAEQRRARSLALVARGINARTWLTRTATGDQAIFVRRSVYEVLGGFAAWPLFEDVDFVRRLKHHGRFAVIPAPVTISARRWLAHGVWRTTLLMYALRLAFYAGVSPATLKRWFKDVRPHRKQDREIGMPERHEARNARALFR